MTRQRLFIRPQPLPMPLFADDLEVRAIYDMVDTQTGPVQAIVAYQLLVVRKSKKSSTRRTAQKVARTVKR